MGMSLNKLWEWVTDREAWTAAIHRVAESDMTERMSWTEPNGTLIFIHLVTTSKYIK